MSNPHFRKTGPGSGASLAATALLVFTHGGVSGAGFFLPNQGMEQTMRGNAWVATADSPAAVHYNPAGLVNMGGPSVEGGLYLIRLGNKVDLDLDLDGDGDTSHDAKDRWQGVPQLYYAQPINEDWAFGIGVSAPFGLGSDWGRHTDFTDVTIQATLKYIRTSAVLSYRVTDTLSIGAGLALDYADATFEQSIPGLAGSKLRFDGDATALTGIFGIHYRPCEQHSFGLVYRTAAQFNLDGDITTNPNFLPESSGSLDFYAPATAAFGYAYKHSDKLTIEANVEWVDFDGLNTLTLRGDAIGPGGSPFPFEWKSSFIWELGASYKFNENYTFHAGYNYNESSQPDKFYNPAVADADRQYINLGVTRQTGKLAVSLGYQFGWSERDVNNSVIGTNGEYHADHHTILAAFRYDF